MYKPSRYHETPCFLGWRTEELVANGPMRRREGGREGSALLPLFAQRTDPGRQGHLSPSQNSYLCPLKMLPGLTRPGLGTPSHSDYFPISC